MGRVLKEAVAWVEDFVREEEEPFSKKKGSMINAFSI